ncbi:MAG: phosphatidylinositol mannoside acyltransferase, partial [Pseudonocardia sp.]|nr:phosphatidylinositol mannoside acyltransferase [Pseudonocardia sp.]
MPAGLAEGMFRVGADLVTRRGGAGPRQLRANLARVLRHAGAEPTEERLDALTVAGLRSYARYWCEAFRLPAMDPAELHAAVDPTVGGVAHLERALANGRGV